VRHSAILTERPKKSWPWRAFGVSTGQNLPAVHLCEECGPVAGAHQQRCQRRSRIVPAYQERVQIRSRLTVFPGYGECQMSLSPLACPANTAT
jgi:hypothetical protein